MYILREIINYVFLIYTVMLMVRILGSWFPKFNQSRFIRFVSFYTDPYLNLFRKIIPPLGGRIDISPIIAFIALRVVEMMVVGLLAKL